MNIIQNFREKVMILKPDKSQGILFVNKDDYIRIEDTKLIKNKIQ